MTGGVNRKGYRIILAKNASPVDRIYLKDSKRRRFLGPKDFNTEVGLPYSRYMIIHVDMDAFYASVEIRDRPELRGKPVVVGGSPTGRGVVSAASYEARRFGIHSAMPTSQVLRRCPDAVFIRPRMEHYVQISRQIRKIFDSFTSLVEPLALDEAFLDVTGCEKMFGPAESIAQQIRTRIRDEVGLIASAGVAPNKYLAKIASDLDKPDGLVIVPPDGIEAFLENLPVSRIWGVGKKCEEKLNRIGIRTIGQLRRLDRKTLEKLFGFNADHFWNLSRGIDSRPVLPDREAKSISHETTFATDVNQRNTLEAWAIELAGQVGWRLRKHEVRGKVVVVKIRFSDFRTITRSVTLAEATNRTADIVSAAQRLLVNELSEFHEPVRLLGVGVSRLTTETLVQRTLFDQEEKDRNGQLDQAADSIAQRFGKQAIRFGKVIEQQIKPGKFENDERFE